jgi:hypothetical protein
MWNGLFVFTLGCISRFVAGETTCTSGSSSNAQMLLQAQRNLAAALPQERRNLSELEASVVRVPGPVASESEALFVKMPAKKTSDEEENAADAKEGFGVATNPSGASAPLDEIGYSAVVDRCCQTEMRQFIERQVANLNLQVCEPSGLWGIVQFHSCSDRQDFDKLSSDLLDDSTKRCTWIASTVGAGCQPMPADCPTYPDLKPASDCGCTTSRASKVTLSEEAISNNNLGGLGPKAGPEELRFTNVGVSDTGDAFDVVVTPVDQYSTPAATNNGAEGAFGIINVGRDSQTTFKFSFTKVGTHTPVRLNEIHMAIFDLDGTAETGIEYASSMGYKGYVTDENPSVVASRLRDGRTKFTSTTARDNIVNPTDPKALTAEQRQNSVMFFYENVTTFQLSFGMEGPDKPYNRNLFFAFGSDLDDRCAS